MLWLPLWLMSPCVVADLKPHISHTVLETSLVGPLDAVGWSVMNKHWS